jgi:hypothetical protein
VAVVCGTGPELHALSSAPARTVTTPALPNRPGPLRLPMPREVTQQPLPAPGKAAEPGKYRLRRANARAFRCYVALVRIGVYVDGFNL